MPVSLGALRRNPVSGGMATCGCASSMNRSRVVPDRGAPTTTGMDGAGFRRCTLADCWTATAALPLEPGSML